MLLKKMCVYMGVCMSVCVCVCVCVCVGHVQALSFLNEQLGCHSFHFWPNPYYLYLFTVDPCASNPCLNGICQAQGANYTCTSKSVKIVFMPHH